MSVRSVVLAVLILAASCARAEKGAAALPCVHVAQYGPAGCVAAGSTVDIAVTLSSDCAIPVQALGYRETLPPGWSFTGLQGDHRPTDMPPPNATGTLEFIWIEVPEFPVEFTITVAVPGTDAHADTLTGIAEYRQSEGALFSAASEIDICVEEVLEGESEGCAFQIGKKLGSARDFLGDFLMAGFVLLSLIRYRNVSGFGPP